MAETKRPSWIGRRLSILKPKKLEVWEVKNEVDLGLDNNLEDSSNNNAVIQQLPNKRNNSVRPKPPGITVPNSPAEDASSITIDSLGSGVSLNRVSTSSKGSTINRASYSSKTSSVNRASYSSRSSLNRGSHASSLNSGERVRVENLPPLSPMDVTVFQSSHSLHSSGRSSSSSKRSSHTIQLVPKTMLNPQSPPNFQLVPENDELKRIAQELVLIGAKERKARSESNGSADRPRSDTGGSSRGLRIQYIPKTSLQSPLSDNNILPEAIPSSLPPSTHLSSGPRINRSLTAVTEEETRMASEYQSDIDEE